MADIEQLTYGMDVRIERATLNRVYMRVKEIPHLDLYWSSRRLPFSAKQKEDFQHYAAKWYAKNLGLPLFAASNQPFGLEERLCRDVTEISVCKVLDLLDLMPSTVTVRFPYREDSSQQAMPLLHIRTEEKRRRAYELSLEADSLNPASNIWMMHGPRLQSNIRTYQKIRKALIEIINYLGIRPDLANLKRNESVIKEIVKDKTETVRNVHKLMKSRRKIVLS